MRKFALAVLLLFALVVLGAWLPSRAQKQAEAPRPAYVIRILYMADTHRLQERQERLLFLTRETESGSVLMKNPPYEGYRNLSSPALRRRIARLPDRAVLYLNEGTIFPLRDKGRDQANDLEDFAAFCDREGVLFMAR